MWAVLLNILQRQRQRQRQQVILQPVKSIKAKRLSAQRALQQGIVGNAALRWALGALADPLAHPHQLCKTNKPQGGKKSESLRLCQPLHPTCKYDCFSHFRNNYPTLRLQPLQISIFSTFSPRDAFHQSAQYAERGECKTGQMNL